MESFLIASMKSVMRLFSQVLRKQINRILNMRMGKSNRGYMIEMKRAALERQGWHVALLMESVD